jgi:hypothetical protein
MRDSRARKCPVKIFPGLISRPFHGRTAARAAVPSTVAVDGYGELVLGRLVYCSFVVGQLEFVAPSF